MAGYMADNFNSYNHFGDLVKKQDVSSDPCEEYRRFHTPVTTGTSVLGIKFGSGVVLAADILGSYGSLARFKNCPRILEVNKNSVIAVSGDYADFQYLKEMIKGKVTAEECLDDGIMMKPKALHCWISRVLYNRRSKVDPLWLNIIVGGIENDGPFLAFADKLGTAFFSDHIATGYGAYIAMPLLRDAYEKNRNMTESEAVNLITKCLQVLYYRDARSLNKYQVAVVTKEKCELSEPLTLEADWSIAKMVQGYE